MLPHPEACDGLGRQGQHEGLARVRPDLDVVRLAIDRQYRRLPTVPWVGSLTWTAGDPSRGTSTVTMRPSISRT